MLLYIGCNGTVAAIDPETGQEAWRTPLQSGFFGSSRQDICLIEDRGRIFAGSNGHLFALDGQTGEILWQNDLEGLGYNDVTLAMAGKSVQMVTRVVRE
jgi:outer membrane protein assembly factor BamB